jgi:ABC-type Fe3+-hydroxamate transport system substrate-binding protein
VLLAAIVGGCSSGGASSSPEPSVAPALGRRKRSRGIAEPQPHRLLPRDDHDDEGTSVELAAEPKKIVSLTPATTEILFQLGAGDRVVATDDGSDYPSKRRPAHVATFSSVDVEEGRRPGARPRRRRWPRLHTRRIDHPAA